MNELTKGTAIRWALGACAALSCMASSSAGAQPVPVVDAYPITSPATCNNATAYSIAHAPNQSFTGDFTLAARVWVDTFEEYDGIISKGDDVDGISPYALQLTGNGGFKVSLNWPTGFGLGTYGEYPSSANAITGGWHHVAAVRSSGTLTLYVDGSPDATYSANYSLLTTAQPLYVGADLPGGDEYFDGTISDVKVFDQALTASQLAALANGAVPQLSVTSHDFGDVIVGSNSAPLSILFRNMGAGAMSVDSILLDSNSDFQPVSTTCPGTLASGESCNISLTYSPTSVGAMSRTLTIATSAYQSSVSVALTGNGVNAAGISVSPSVGSFAPVALNVGSSTQTFTVTNSGTSNLSISAIATSGGASADFAPNIGSCGAAVAPGGQCTFTVTFSSATAGTRSTTLSIASNASGSPLTLTLEGFAGTAATIPTLSEWGMIAMAALLALSMLVAMRRKQDEG